MTQTLHDGARSATPISPLPRRIVIGLDGSLFSERSLPVASDLAGAIDADLMLLSVVEYPGEWHARASYLDRLRRSYHARMLALLVEPDARRALARRPPDELLCLATRGRTAIIRSVLGSVAFSEVAAGHASLLVGFTCARPALDRPVAIAVGGGVPFDAAVAIAASWAAKLGVTVEVITAAVGARDAHSLDAEHAVNALTDLGVHATATVLTVGQDPIDTVARWLHRRPPSLLVAPTTLNSGEARALLHSHVADLVGQIDVAVLAVPSRRLAGPDRPSSAPD